MTKGEFLYNIRNNLTMLPKEEVEGIIEDYTGTHGVFVDDTNRHYTGGLSRIGICGG